MTSNIIGATKMDQLKENIGSIDIDLSAETLAEINAVHAELSQIQHLNGGFKTQHKKSNDCFIHWIFLCVI